MLKRLIALGTAAISGLVCACEDGPATLAGQWRSPATWSSMVYASSKGPIWVEIHGQPFAEDSPTFKEQVASLMTNKVFGRPTSFTSDQGLAAYPKFRVVLAFNPPDSLDARDLCRGQVPVALETREKITLAGAFCDGETPLASIRGWVAKTSGPGDKRFAQLMAQVTRDLFGQAP